MLKTFYPRATQALGVMHTPLASDDAVHDVSTPSGMIEPLMARLAVYDSLVAPPRVEEVSAGDPRAFIESLAARTYHLAREAGGSIPFTVIREVVENLIHASFREVVVTIMDRGSTIRFADQGPGIPDKARAFMPGFTTATHEMKRFIRGVGSGLPLVRECLSCSSGVVTIEDNLGKGTVVTLHMDGGRGADTVVGVVGSDASAVRLPRLTVRQKQVLSLIMEYGSAGPSLVARELHVGLSTAHRDLAALESAGVITADDTGKRTLTRFGQTNLDQLLYG